MAKAVERCPVCNGEMPEKAKGRPRIYCTPECKRAAEVEKAKPAYLRALPADYVEPAPSLDEPPQTIRGAIERDLEACERGLGALDRCIAAVERMLREKYDIELSSHLAWLISQRAGAAAKLRQFGERVKNQSLELTPEQQRRAVARFIQKMSETDLAGFRALIDTRIDDIELVS